MANRPQIDPERKQAASVEIKVRMTPRQAAQVQRMAKQRGETVSAIMREAVENMASDR